MGSQRAMPAGYVHGPLASIEATRRALANMCDPAAMILVEGVSDQIAVETLARLSGRDLIAARVVVVPIGGAQAVGRFVADHPDVPMVALADAAEAPLFARALCPSDVFVCRADLEDELIRAVGADAALTVLASERDLVPFRTLQKQPAWAERPVAHQLRRFIGAGAGRKLRYARLLTTAAAELERVPAPLAGVLERRP